MNKNNYRNIYFFGMLCLLVSFWTLLYYNFSIDYTGEGHLDIPIHINIARYLFNHEVQYNAIEDFNHIFSYPLFHFTLKSVHIITNLEYEACVAIIMALSNVFLVVAIRAIIIENIVYYESYYADFISIASVIFMNAKGTFTMGKYYADVCGPNPIHNPTLIFVRPFGAICILYFLRYIKDVYGENAKKNLCGWSALLFISLVAKPNFAMVFAPVMAAMVLTKVVRNKDIKIGFQCLAGAFPSLILLIIQYIYMKKCSQQIWTHIQFGSFANLTVEQVLLVTLATLPSVIILFDIDCIKKKEFLLLAHLGIIIGWIQMYCFTNGPSGDFSWGYDFAIIIITIAALANGYTQKRDSLLWSFRFGIANIIFAYQIYVGIKYMVIAYNLHEYYF